MKKNEFSDLKASFLQSQNIKDLPDWTQPSLTDLISHDTAINCGHVNYMTFPQYSPALYLCLCCSLWRRLFSLFSLISIYYSFISQKF